MELRDGEDGEVDHCRSSDASNTMNESEYGYKTGVRIEIVERYHESTRVLGAFRRRELILGAEDHSGAWLSH